MVEKTDSEAVVREIKRRTRKKYSSEEKIRIVLEGLRGEESIAELCRKEGIQANVYYKWSKDFLEAGKKRLQGDTAREATSSEVVDLKKENDQESELSVRQTLLELDVNRSSFYEWYREEGYAGLAMKKPQARRFWNRIPEEERKRVVKIALERLEDSARQLAWYITDTEGYFLSESSVYRILRAYDLLPSPAYTVIRAAEKFANPTTRVHQLWQTDFTYMKVIGWGWYYLASVLDDYSRYIIWEVEQEIGRFVEYYNNERYHESLGNVTPADVYFDRHREIIARREQIKRRTLKQRKHYNLTHKVGESQPQRTLKPSITSEQKVSGTF